LLADTEALSFDTLRRVLPEDYELSMVKDWEQLFRETRKTKVPLVVIDLALLGQEGVHNIRKLKEESPQIRIVALANYLSEAFAQAMPEGLELSGILQKPLDEAFLSENLGKYLQ
jgi:ActR/RegA family two-component response regulator